MTRNKVPRAARGNHDLPAQRRAATRARAGFVALLAVLLMACGTAAPRPATAVLPAQAIDPARVTLGAVEWHAGSPPGIDAAERDALRALLRESLLEPLRRLPPDPSGRAAVLQAAITRVDTVSPALNATSALLLFVPLDGGGAAVEIEAVDPDSGERLAALAFEHAPPLSELTARYRKLGPAEIALRRAGAAFAAVLRPQAAAVPAP